MAKLNRLSRGLTFVFSSALLFGIATGLTLEANKDAIDSYFGTHSTKLVQKGDGELFKAFTPDEKYLTSDGKADTSKIVKAHEDLAVQIQGEGTVLLKNNLKDGKAALPLATSSENKLKVSLFGVRSSSTITGAFIGHRAAGNNQTVHFDEALAEEGFDVNPTLNEAYENYIATKQTGRVPLLGENDFPYMGMYGMMAGLKTFETLEASVDDLKAQNENVLQSIDEYNKVGVVVLGRAASEGVDWVKNPAQMNPAEDITNPMQLTAKEKAILALAKEKCDKVVVIINAVNPMEIDDLKKDDGVDAILWMGIGANYAPKAVAQILTGKITPSGHLSDTYASSSLSAPAMMNYGDYAYGNEDATVFKKRAKGSGNKYIVEAEGIYTGYHYYETRYADYVTNSGNARSSKGSSFEGAWEYSKEVTYPFGYGLSYTTFEQTIVGAPKVSHKGHDFTMTFKVKVTNTGNVKGKDAVQIYGQAPYIAGGVEKSAIQLLAFDKTEELEPGESQTLEIKVDMQNIASWDSKAKDGKGSYILDAGDYYFAVGNGAHEALNNIFAKKGVTPNADNKMTEAGVSSKAYKYTYNVDTRDEDTFNISKSGVQVKNSLQEADPNHYEEGKMTNLSRNDWDGTFPKEYKGFIATDAMIKLINGGTYDVVTDGDTSSILFGQEGDLSYLNLKGAPYNWEDWDKLLNQLDLTEAMSFILHGNRDYLPMNSVGFIGGKFTENGPNGVGDRAFKTLSANEYGDQKPAWAVAADDPNAKYQMTIFPSAPVMAATFNPRLAYAQGEMMGNDALFVGLPILWGPSMNTHRNGYNGRNLEYYSEDPILTGNMGMEYSVGALSKGLIAAPKHFAFNDQETNRSGVSPYMTEQKARELELRAFQIAFEASKYDTDEKDVGLLGVMTSFSKIGPTEVTCSKGLLTDILRGEWGYRGYIVSDLEDDTDYFAQALYAGITSWDSTTTLEKIGVSADTIKNDPVLLNKVKDAVHCDLWVLTQSNYMNMVNANTEMVKNMTWWRATYISVIAASAALAALSLGGAVFTTFYKGMKKEEK